MVNAVVAFVQSENENKAGMLGVTERGKDTARTMLRKEEDRGEKMEKMKCGDAHKRLEYWEGMAR